MNSTLQFFKLHGSSIMTVVIIIITLLTAFSMLGINLNPKRNKRVEKVVTIESLDTISSSNKHAFCQKFSSRPEEINKHCNKLTANNCKSVGCCVLADGKKCVAGNKHGPIFHTEKGKETKIKFYHHKTKCHGDCPSKPN